MNNKTICKKVTSLLSLYIDNKLDYKQSVYIEEHLANCPDCKQKYLYLKSLIKNLKNSYAEVMEMANQKQNDTIFSIKEHEKFMQNVSPYVDNELNSRDCFEFRKYLMKSKMAQKELKKTYILQREMRLAFDNTKKRLKNDFSSDIAENLKYAGKIPAYRTTIKYIFSKKTAKVAILAGLIFFGGAEFNELLNHYKQKPQDYVESVQQIPADEILNYEKIEKKAMNINH